MPWFENIKNSLGKKQLLARTPKSVPLQSMPDYSKIQDIAIVYPAGNAEQEDQVQEFAGHLRAQGKKVFLMGFLNQKELGEKRHLHIQSQYFWREYLGLLNLPIKEKLAGFIKQPFDLLINLSPEFNLPILALCAYSEASLKIATHSKEAEPFHQILIDSPSNNLLELGIQMENYLLLITPNPQKV